MTISLKQQQLVDELKGFFQDAWGAYIAPLVNSLNQLAINIGVTGREGEAA